MGMVEKHAIQADDTVFATKTYLRAGFFRLLLHFETEISAFSEGQVARSIAIKEDAQ